MDSCLRRNDGLLFKQYASFKKNSPVDILAIRWIPAFAGMTDLSRPQMLTFGQNNLTTLIQTKII